MREKKWKLQIGGRELIIETGLLAEQANGAVTVRYGDTEVLATATMSSRPSQSMSYFPLMVDYEERYYAAGKIKGSRFIKREGRPSDEAVLAGRAIDRSIRPLFDHRMRQEVQVVVTVLSYDGENDPDSISIIAASAALAISDIPWGGPVGAVKIGKNNGDLILNPLTEERESGQLDLTVVGTENRINMIEAGSQELPEKEMVEALALGQQTINKIETFIRDIQKEVGKEKREVYLLKATAEEEKEIKDILKNEGLEEAIYWKVDHEIREEKLEKIREKVKDFLYEKYHDDEEKLRELEQTADVIFDETADSIVHKHVLEKEERIDERKLDQLREISCQVKMLPRTHGSALFNRGKTQVLTITTLGSPGDEQIIDTMESDTKKRYIHHYNFPPYSVGEVRFMRGPGRREIGHGALAEKALLPVLPNKEKFPYTMLLVSEVLSSNGSSSMASTCGSTLSLMDAGVPIKRPVAGIAMGVIIDDNNLENYKVLTDIQGMEDHYGDMDFKVAGTEEGITALQMDVKVKGVSLEILQKALQQARQARLEILKVMLSTISQPRSEMSQYAPRIITLKINPDKIRDVIGPGGKVINEIIDETGVAIDIEDDGSIFITSSDELSAQKAKEWIENLTREIKPGEIFKARITKIMNFGAFAELIPGQEGLIHISELADHRVAKVEDVVKVGDIVPVKVKEIDSQGRINLSMKDMDR